MYDVHTHFIPPEVIGWLQENQAVINAKWITKDSNKAEFLSVNGNWEFELKEAFVNPQLYLEEQGKQGVIHSLISPIPQLFLYEFPTDITKELASVYNDSLAGWVKQNDTRISGLATLPMNDLEAASSELDRVMDRGLKGAIVASSWSGQLLSEDRFIPFWETANRRKAIIFIHPLLCTDPRLSKRMMPNLIGVPWETTICATDLLLSGMLERYPDVKILLAHGGGFLPYQIGRMNKGYEKWNLTFSHLKETPLELAKRFWYDTVLWNTDALSYLVDLVGEDRVVQGSDFPFDLCEWPPAINGDRGFQSLMLTMQNFITESS
ncbi:amidohydrolase family protein [Paenibacillus periandrae]|uniref:amidohydrolase family protein n=1 Tax=Paenibacillus periandrae TaxID=1761741 RepID=UPI001F0907E7|nr:amidohydrolase family protein [Paenibacillus periandrae]